jgi:hypothetical protein
MAVKAGNTWIRRLFIILAVVSSINLFFF